MNKQQLVDASLEHLRFAVAGTLGIKITDYRASIDTQTAVNRYLTNIMSLGYNGDFVEALKEAIEYRFAGGAPSSDEFDDFVAELRATRNTFHREMSAYSHLHRKFEEGESPELILEQVKAMTPLEQEYKIAEQ